jgi:Zn-dependent peptidase ImmA (M78 family)
MTNNGTRIRVMARTLLGKYGMERMIPIRLSKLCRKLGIEICHSKARHIDGTLFIHGDRKIILVSTALPYERRRFTVAHELGHYVLGHQAAFSLDSPESWVPREEQAANVFAAELLMPKTALQSIHYKHDIKQLAQIFGVSPLAMQIRLEENLNKDTFIY